MVATVYNCGHPCSVLPTRSLGTFPHHRPYNSVVVGWSTCREDSCTAGRCTLSSLTFFVIPRVRLILLLTYCYYMSLISTTHIVTAWIDGCRIKPPWNIGMLLSHEEEQAREWPVKEAWVPAQVASPLNCFKRVALCFAESTAAAFTVCWVRPAWRNSIFHLGEVNDYIQHCARPWEKEGVFMLLLLASCPILWAPRSISPSPAGVCGVALAGRQALFGNCWCKYFPDPLGKHLVTQKSQLVASYLNCCPVQLKS